MKWQKTDADFLQTLDFVAFDTETTGLWAPANRIVELGAVKFRLGEYACNRFQALVNPERPIPAETAAIHGITNSMVQNADTVAPVLEEFMDFCGPDAIMVAHNAMFDIFFIGCELDRTGLPLPENIIVDTVDIFRRFCPGLDSYSLLSLARQFHISKTQNHRAADDAALVWRLFLHASEEFPYVSNLKAFRRLFTTYAMAQWQGETRELPSEYADIRVAIDEKRRLEISYQRDSQLAQTRVIRPSQVHWHKSNFYVSAYCELTESERTFRLDRIKEFKLIR
ncbi:MAG TPA: exonuclease domain-containing protein [Acidobacteriota bacterium]|nr:exonuclease domain-containing protein [Acidobacteriota bacterium]